MRIDDNTRPTRKRTTRALSLSDSEAEDRDMIGSDTEYTGRRRRDSRGKAKRRRALMSAKTKSAPAEKHDYQQKAPLAPGYQRQPSFRVITKVHANPVWQACVQKLNRIIDGDRAHRSKVYAKSQRKKLYDLNGDWGVIADMDSEGEGSHGGPCAGCIDANIDCIVKLSRGSAEGAHMITTGCIRCNTDHTSCDLKQPPATFIPTPSRDFLSNPANTVTTPSGPRPSSQPISHAQKAAATIPTCRSNPAGLALAVNTPTANSTAITRLRKFHERAGAILTQGGAIAMEYETILMFEQGEEAITSIEEDLMGRTNDTDRFGRAVDYMSKFAKELRSMIASTEAWNFRVEGMFSTSKRRLMISERT